MKYLNSSALSPEKRALWVKAVERLYQPILRDPGASDEKKKRAKQKLEAVRRSG